MLSASDPTAIVYLFLGNLFLSFAWDSVALKGEKKGVGVAVGRGGGGAWWWCGRGGVRGGGGGGLQQELTECVFGFHEYVDFV